jgi:hypothetical protein
MRDHYFLDFIGNYVTHRLKKINMDTDGSRNVKPEN